MAVRKRNRKTKTRAFRSTRGGRKQEVCQFTEQEVQVLKALSASIQEAMDSNWNTGPEWLRGSVWAGIHLRLGEKLRKIHNPLQKRIFPHRRVQSVRLATKSRCLGEGDRTYFPFSFADGGGRLPGNAGLGEYDDQYHATSYGEKVVRSASGRSSNSRKRNSRQHSGHRRG